MRRVALIYNPASGQHSRRHRAAIDKALLVLSAAGVEAKAHETIAPGSAGVSAGTPVLVVASRELPKSVSVVATGDKGVSHAAALERTTAPAHAARAPFPAPVYYRASAVGLRANRHYTVALDDVAQNGCSPYVRIAGNPRFST